MNIILIKKIHSIAKSKGFWDKERNLGEMFMLVISELGECLEAHRKGRFAKQLPANLANDHFIEFFEKSVKDTFEDEIADAYIRVCDMIGGLYPKSSHIIGFSFYPDVKDNHNAGEMLLWLSGVVLEAYQCIFNSRKEEGWDLMEFHGANDRSKAVYLYGCLSAIEHFCFIFGIELIDFVELKLKYNEQRPRLHGKNY